MKELRKLTEFHAGSENKATALLLIPIKRRKCEQRIRADTAIITAWPERIVSQPDLKAITSFELTLDLSTSENYIGFGQIRLESMLTLAI